MSGDTQEVILLVPTAQGVDQQIADWLDELNEKLNTKFTTADVTFIAEVYTY